MSPENREFSFIIVAGGQGKRAGSPDQPPKQFRAVGGKPMWFWSAELALTLEQVSEIIIVMPDDTMSGDTFLKNNTDKKIKTVKGGEQRADSVMNGLIASSLPFVLIHDAARPFVSDKLCRRLIERVSDNIGAIPVMSVSEALKKITFIDGSNKDVLNSSEGISISAVDRENIYGTQTPQAFPRVPLIEAMRKIRDMKIAPKDEAEAWLMMGHELSAVEGERLNFKVTWPEDFRIAEGVLSGMTRTDLVTRTGLGYDIHPLVPGRKLILGGVEIESPLGLLGHSDADALTHAVSDALLGGAGMPDIGNLFPASDEKYRGADSMELLADVVRRVREAGWKPSFIDCVVKAQVPVLNPYITDMKRALGKIVGCEVNIKAKSGEHIPPEGDAVCIVCHVAATMTESES